MNAYVVSYEDHVVMPHGEGIGWDILIRMELLTPLLDVMAEKPLDRHDVVRLGIHLCRALELCQKHDIIHRDIKPESIFVSENGDYKLGDFGIARTAEKTAGALSKKGTYTYMAPEVYRGDPYGPGVDLYSLGIVMYRLLNGNRAPFLPAYPAPITHSQREQALARRICGEEIPLPVNAPDQLGEVVRKACAYDPRQRYETPTQLRQALEGLEGETPVPPGDCAAHRPGPTAVREEEKTQLLTDPGGEEKTELLPRAEHRQAAGANRPKAAEAAPQSGPSPLPRPLRRRRGQSCRNPRQGWRKPPTAGQSLPWRRRCGPLSIGPPARSPRAIFPG